MKFFHLFLALIIATTLTACGGSDEPTPQVPTGAETDTDSETEEILNFNEVLEQGLEELDKVE